MSSTSPSEKSQAVARPLVARPRKRIFRWSLLICACLLGLAVAIHVGGVYRLNSVKRSIGIGDSRASVERVLGKCTVEYFTGFPEEGGQPTVFGASYGSLMNLGRTKLDSAFYAVFGIPDFQTFGISEFYNRYCSQSLANWPLRIEYDSNGVVTAIK